MPRLHCRNCKSRFTPAESSAASELCLECAAAQPSASQGASRWFHMVETEVHGPYSWAQLQALAARAAIGPDDMLTQEGCGHWVRARALRQLFGVPVTAVAPPTPPAPTPKSVSVAPSPTPVAPSPGQREREAEVTAAKAQLDVAPLQEEPEHTEISRADTPPACPLVAEEPRIQPQPAPAASANESDAPGEVPRHESAVPVRTPPRPGVSRWPSLGIGMLLGSAIMFFGLQWVQNEEDAKNQGRSGVVVEEQESFHEAPAKNDVAKKHEKDLLSNVDRLARVVEHLNRHRKEAGLAELVVDANLSRACAEHARYLARTVDPRDATPTKVNTKDAKNPESSADGAKTALTDLVVYEEPTKAVERWMGRIFSRVQILTPELVRIGIGFEQSANGDWICVLDPVGGRDETVRGYPAASQRAATEGVRAVLYPAPNQNHVPCVGFDRIDEGRPAGSGFPISLTFPSETVLRRVQASMMDEVSKQAIEVRVSSPEQPLNPNLQRTTIGIHPLRPLEPGRTYLVLVSLVANDAEWRHVWRFATSK